MGQERIFDISQTIRHGPTSPNGEPDQPSLAVGIPRILQEPGNFVVDQAHSTLDFTSWRA